MALLDCVTVMVAEGERLEVGEWVELVVPLTLWVTEAV